MLDVTGIWIWENIKQCRGLVAFKGLGHKTQERLVTSMQMIGLFLGGSSRLCDLSRGVMGTCTDLRSYTSGTVCQSVVSHVRTMKCVPIYGLTQIKGSPQGYPMMRPTKEVSSPFLRTILWNDQPSNRTFLPLVGSGTVNQHPMDQRLEKVQSIRFVNQYLSLEPTFVQTA